jgi:hypothetical protein
VARFLRALPPLTSTPETGSIVHYGVGPIIKCIDENAVART